MRTFGIVLTHLVPTGAFESNFPVDKQGCSYAVLFNAFQRIANEAGWSSAERSELFSGSARRFYRLNQ